MHEMPRQYPELFDSHPSLSDAMCFEKAKETRETDGSLESSRPRSIPNEREGTFGDADQSCVGTSVASELGIIAMYEE